MGASLHTIVILANSSWSFMHQREHEMAKEFARRGYRVFFVEEMPSAASALRNALVPRTHRDMENVLPDRITVLQPPMCLTFFRSSLIPVVDRYQLKRWLRNFTDEYAIQECLLVYSFSYWRYLEVTPALLNAVYSIYDYSDDESVYARNQRALRRLIWGAGILGKEVDLVTYTSRAMESSGIVRHAKNALWLPNAVSDAFVTADAHAAKPGRKTVVGYVGTLAADVVDAELLKKIDGDERFSLRLAGPANDRLSRMLPRSKFAGLLDRPRVISFIDQCDVCIVPFTSNATTEVVDPLKMYEYCARGKPIVATRTKALGVYAEILYLSMSHDEFLCNIARAANEDDADRRRERIEFARRNTWNHRAERLMSSLP